MINPLALQEDLAAQLPEFLRDLEALVNVDCGTYDKAGVDRTAGWMRDRFGDWGWSVERFPQEKYGDCYYATKRGRGAARVFMIGHSDTVYPQGTCAVRPMRVAGGRVIGPGAGDMKAGLLAGLYAVRALEAAGADDYGEVNFFVNSEEEIGSPVSRDLYRKLVRGATAGLTLEAARENGDVVSARKAAGLGRIVVGGRSAHAGVEPHKGANALVELGHQMVAAAALNGISPGVTVSVGLAHGGTATNVVPDEAWADLDLRSPDQAGMDALDAAFAMQAERLSVPGASVTITTNWGFPPLVKTDATAWLVGLAQGVAARLGFEVSDAATGGASDANWMGAEGVPVLDGLGPIAGAGHCANEFVVLDSIVPRTALLAGLIAEISRSAGDRHAS